MKFELVNGKTIEVSQEEIAGFITQTVCISNAYWRHSSLLTEGEVTRFLKGESGRDELKKVARYILVYTENLSFAAYLFDKSEGNPDQTKEFNMPAVKKLRRFYQAVKDNRQMTKVLARLVHEMENICLEIGADPL